MPARKPTPPEPGSNEPMDRPARALDLLGFFYPIHYKAGIKVEDALRGGKLSRHQVAVLWHIHSEGREGREMHRKEIERALKAWFEISGAAITKAIRGMAAPPLELVVQVEDPRSAREKIVRLTPEGEKHIEAMMARGVALIERIMGPMDAHTIREGIGFFQAITDSIAEMDAGDSES